MNDTFDTVAAISTIKGFISDKLAECGLDGFVVGLSGGLDSSVAASLAVKAVGADSVLGVLMPHRSSHDSSLDDATRLAEKLGIDYRIVDISPMIDAYFQSIDDSNRLRVGNKMARERMSILFDISHQENRLVLGTGNRTEICLGYTTWYGDAACSINPLGQLYKTEVRLVAKDLGVPESIITKAPTADLWEGQTDEGEIGVTYDELDRLLKSIIEDGETSTRELQDEGARAADIDRVLSLINGNSFKRRMPDVAPLGKGTIPDHINLEP
jgi:NAD+ synthase